MSLGSGMGEILSNWAEIDNTGLGHDKGGENIGEADCLDANFTFVVFRERVGCDAGPMIPI